ncbi:MAG: choice-of-anchor B family protein [Bacteroidota bacterium]|nr:choice-of-anchor B family protein [Bacteroidota bacterium]
MKNLYKMLTAAVTLIAGISAHAQSSLNVTQQYHLSYGSESCANICGYVDATGNEYALVGAAQGMSIVNITIPTAPVTISQIPNVDNLWKEIKVYGNYAYVTTEGGGGLQIVDLSSLPLAPTVYQNYTGDGAIAGQIDNIHALHIDTTLGFCYLFGSNLFGGGAIVLDLNTDPYNPTYVGNYMNPAHNYVHDGYVDNDTLYAGHIYDGVFCVVDMTNKTAPVILATQSTTTNFTHNTWPSNDKDFLFTTDENTNSFLTAYNISDLNNIQVMDKTQSEFPNSGSIGHNTHILDNWAITSWYKDGFVITDVTRPMNLVNVGWYDNYVGGGNGFNGNWGVFPFFPSGTIVLSNIEDGLYIYNPTYVRACYLEGTVKDSICGTALTGVTVTISTVNVTEVSDINGEVRTGTAIPGTYNVTFTKPGYVTYTMNNLVFTPGVVDTFNIRMFSSNAVGLTGNTSNTTTTNDIPGVQVMFSNVNNTYNFVSDANGDFSNCSVISGDYEIAAAAWGYNGVCYTDSIYPANSIANFQLTPGYSDDFTFDLGWSVATTSSSGAWERGEPDGTNYNNPGDANPEFDSNNDCFDQAYVTGNAGGSASQDDVDGGETTLTSPVMDLTVYFDPWIHYERWFFNDGGSGNPNDSLVIRLTDGTTTKTIEKVIATTAGNSSWVPKNYRVLDYFTPTATMRIIVTTADNTPGHLVEAGFDAFNVADSSLQSVGGLELAGGISVYPNPFDGSASVQYTLAAMPVDGAYIEVKDLSGRIIATQPINAQSGTIQLGQELAGGIYFVQLVNGATVSPAVRLIKTK